MLGLDPVLLNGRCSGLKGDFPLSAFGLALPGRSAPESLIHNLKGLS
jgi:hypothetical protein